MLDMRHRRKATCARPVHRLAWRSWSGDGIVKLGALIISFAVCFAVAALGAKLTTPSLPGWYAALNKPAWTPPSWLFGPVWTILFAMMAIAVWLVWMRVGLAGAPFAFALFAVQLALNAGWSLLFFGLRNPGAAFVEVVIFWIAIALTAIAFSEVAMVAGALLLPYLAWVSFAAVLNFAIWRLNVR
jgi:benzodiazapine receptor